MIALALSGGGSRAIAFHLGCLRALNEKGILNRVSVLSTVSGGSVIGALYAYSNDDFDSFDKNVVALLRRGLQWSMVLRLFSPYLMAQIAATTIISRPIGIVSANLGFGRPFRRWASRSDTLEGTLKSLYKKRRLADVARDNLKVVINACDLRTGTAFRFGNTHSGAWRYGTIKNNDISVAHAVACSAAYPMFLPAFDRNYTFMQAGIESRKRVVITDGGVYDNLGITCLEPNRNKSFSLHTFPAEYIICCHAGYGQTDGAGIPFGFYTRAAATMEALFRKVQDGAIQRLHMYKSSGQLKGFILPYLGQQDNALPMKPLDLVSRDEVYGYPTNFAGMSRRFIDLLSKRGEQLTRLLLAHYCPEL